MLWFANCVLGNCLSLSLAPTGKVKVDAFPNHFFAAFICPGIICSTQALEVGVLIKSAEQFVFPFLFIEGEFNIAVNLTIDLAVVQNICSSGPLQRHV